MIAPTPFFADRGCHTQIYEEIRSLQKLGHEIVLCTYGLGRDMPGVRTVRTFNFPWYRKLAAGPSVHKILLLPFLTATTLRTIARWKPDVVHAHLHEGALIASFCRIFFPKKKYLFDMQGSLTGECVQHGFVREGSAAFRFLAFLERRIARGFFVITQSDSMMKELASFGVPSSRTANVHDGVDTDIFKPQPPDKELVVRFGAGPSLPRVLYMGLFAQYQGTDLLFEAFGVVAKKKPEARFFVIGYPDAAKYRSLCEKMGIGRQVFFLGRVDYAELPRHLSIASIAVAPKIAATEGDGKIYNYMAMGLPTVTFDRSVSREILGDTGIYAKLGDPGDLAEKIVWAIDHPAEAAELGRKSRERAVAELSWDAVGRRIHEVYQKL